jgi:SpoIID/LytB domain protein
VVVPAADGLVARSTDARAVEVVERFPRPADGSFELVGRGFGHGLGLSQWGARQAAAEGVGWRTVVERYYPGTTLETLTGRSAGRPVDVRLGQFLGQEVGVRAEPGLAIRYTNAKGRLIERSLPVRVRGTCEATAWRVRMAERGVALDARCGRDWRTWRGADRIEPASSVRFTPSDGLLGVTSGGGSGPVERRGYRGALRVDRAGRVLVPVNVVPLEAYLRGVVPREMPASWPQTALRAQAVAARTYAMHERAAAGGRSFDVYDTTQSQVYAGAVAYDRRWRIRERFEQPSTDAAIAATAGSYVRAADGPAFTAFSSSNGGVSARGSLPYLRAFEDPWDDASLDNPLRRWTDTVRVGELEARFPRVGTVRELRVTRRAELGVWDGRILELRVVGSAGTAVVVGDAAVRSALGTPSSFVTVR